MPDAVEVAAGPPVAQQQQQGTNWRSIIGAFVKQMIFFYVASSFFKGYFNPKSSSAPGNVTVVGTGKPSFNLFPPSQPFDIYFFMDESPERFTHFEDEASFLWMEKGIKYGDWNGGPDNDGTYTFHKSFKTPEALIQNRSIYLHTFVVKSGQSPDPTNRDYFKREVLYEVQQLNKYKKKHYKKTANLLTGESEQSDEDLAKAETMKFEILNFWHPNISVNLVDDQTQWTQGQVPHPLNEDLKFSEVGDFYKPILFMNTYWNLGSEYMPVNETVKELNLTVTYYPISLMKYQLYASQKMQSKWESMMPGSATDDDDGQDYVKQALLETNPVLLGVTVLVSILHTVFEVLAFKNDIQFWKDRNDLSGLSVRSVLFNIFQSLIVFLYICDNETNFMVKVTVGIGLLIECWKIPKVLNVEVDRDEKVFGMFPKIKFSDKGSYVESETKVYDQMAFRYLGIVLFPLLVGYAIYSVIYVEQKGWYSWILNMLYGYLLTFGFITMTPQLFINYKLKSVAHLPWRMLTYKFINTFIDDLFAFVIRMPWLYRIGCFRDDIIFLIYVYQRWIYRVDPTRLNEFGTKMEPEGVKAIEGAEPEEPEEQEESKKDK